jgi:hypothetical protein
MGYNHLYLWVRKNLHLDTIMPFIQDVGVPQTLILDKDPEEAKKKSKELCWTFRIQQKVTVPYSPWQNLAEASIRELKRAIRRALRRTNTPLRLWGYCGIWCCAVLRLTSNFVASLEGRTPEEFVTGSTPDHQTICHVRLVLDCLIPYPNH